MTQETRKVKFSIITACLNCSSLIERTCKSIIALNYKNFEWIVIDGDSNDGTLEIIKKYQEQISCLSIELDSGIYEAMNKGIRLASGEYLIFMNAGDTFYDCDTLSIVSKNLGPDLLYGKTLKRSKNKDKICTYPDTINSDYLLNNTLPHQSTYFKKETFSKYGLYNETYKIAGDYELYARFILKAKISYKYINKPLSIFYLGGVSSDKKFRNILKKEQDTIRKLYFKGYLKSMKFYRHILRNFYMFIMPKLLLKITSLK